MNYLLDTNVISEVVSRRPNESVVRWVESLPLDKTYLSVFTIGEIRSGIAQKNTSKRQTRLRDWLDNDLIDGYRGRILSFDVTASLVWGELHGSLKKLGYNMPTADSLIAATALRYEMILVTPNVKDFQQTNIKLLNPWDEGIDVPANGSTPPQPN